MSHLVARILLAILIVPLALLLDLIVFLALEDNWLFGTNEQATAVANGVAGAFAVVCWWLLWRKSVRWTRGRVRGSIVAFAAAGGAGVGAGLFIGRSITDEVGVFVGCWTTTLLWLTATLFFWRETPAERSARVARAGIETVVCPTCGYNLTGLTETRCPECGTRFTIEELLAAQPSRAAAELETT